MKNVASALTLFLALFIVSCNSSEKSAEKEKEATPKTDSVVVKKNIDSLISFYESKRKSIEASLDETRTFQVSTKSLRPEVKQKWRKIDFYAKGDTLLRVKSYPYEGVTKRTEEFYYVDNHIAVVVMENNGDWTQGQKDAHLDKIFYFNDGILIGEKGDDNPYLKWEGETDELLLEGSEYVKIFHQQRDSVKAAK